MRLVLLLAGVISVGCATESSSVVAARQSPCAHMDAASTPGEALGCFDVVDVVDGVDVVEGDDPRAPRAVIELTKHRWLFALPQSPEGTTCMAGNRETACPDALAPPGLFVVDGALPGRAGPGRWSQSARGDLSLRYGELDRCFVPEVDGYVALGQAASSSLSTVRLKRRVCPSVRPSASPSSVGDQELPQSRPQPARWGSSMPECFAAEHLRADAAHAGCYEATIKAATSGGAITRVVLRLTNEPFVVDGYRGRECLYRNGDDHELEPRPCPLVRSWFDQADNARALILQAKASSGAGGKWALTDDGHLLISVHGGEIGAGACLRATDDGFVGRLMQWTDFGATGEFDGRDVALAKIECPVEGLRDR